MLAKHSQAPRLFREHALSLRFFASKLAPIERRRQKALCAARNLFSNAQSVVHPFEPIETLRMLVKKAVLCLALLSAGFIAGYAAKPTPQLQVTAGQLMECGELMIPTLGM
ncbi:MULTISPECIES: hypothetical protein [Pseudomonas]|uniref:hypothetical protein n=1 Tax=Pseudomonas TaxID=286 RepID=UPI000FD725BA|nr:MULTISPECIES: hypothetical protein [Pseudomonas]MBJ2209777.1 hypothetical protein [Pseudomonas carnis]MCF5685675.1 hypothetical protein [Pseudomonas sp. PA-1-3F]